MTDEQAFLELTKRFGIEPRPFVSNKPGKHYEISQDDSDKVDGYYGFLTNWSFDSDGKFLQLGIWE